MDIAFTGLLVNLLSGLGGAILGAAVTYWLEHRKYLKTLTFEFHKELNQESMMVHRTATQSVLAQSPNDHLGVLIERVPDELHSVWVITGYYDRLYAAIIHGMIDKRLISPLFGELFCFFYFGFFEKQLVPANWDISRNMSSLKEIIKSKTHPDVWKRWVRDAKADADKVRDRG